jgi:predicted Zn-dependent protease
MSGEVFAAQRFDGRYAVAVPVRVSVEDESVVVRTIDGSPLDREPVALASISEPYAHAPRTIGLRNGVTLEVVDRDRAFARALERAGFRSSRVVLLQSYGPAAVLAVAAIIALCAAIYLVVLPRATHWAAFKLPPRLEARMGQRVLQLLDEHGFEPSRLAAETRQRIAQGLARTADRVAPGVQYRLEFRRTASGEVNAFTLPGGIIVLLDSTEAFCRSIDEASVLGVLGHELGHVVHKHATRSVLHSFGVGSIGSLLWGDFSGMAASVPIVLSQLRYSRDFETEADEFAVRVLRANELTPQPLLSFFECLRRRPEQRAAGGIPSFLMSHPPTEERMQHLEALGTHQNATTELHCPPEPVPPIGTRER